MAQTISMLAKSAGVKPDTVRYYERLGLLPPPARSAAAYRLYGVEASERLVFIKSAQRMGLRLADIKELLDIIDRGQCPCGHTQRVVERRMAEVEAEIEQLQRVRDQLRELKTRNDTCMEGTSAEWSCVTGLDGKEVKR